MVATTMYGTALVWQRPKRRWLAVLCGILIILTGFSRNFLGVHTPQDVVVGFTESIILIALVGFVQKRVEGNEKLVDRLTAAGLVLVVLVLIYIMFKPYPMDYVGGKLLVDPQKMMNDTFKACGGFTGFMIGSYIDRHYTHYEIPAGASNLPVLSCVGFGIMLAWSEYFAPATIVLALGGHWGNFLARFLMVIFGIVVWPMVIRKECRTEQKN
jgi:hypothetical protein